ncbi:hypothetical protein KU73_03910 [Pectobacterium wasabiae]|uniref:Uncharacterized protein n=1 Tax=Pectobacterium wasabiae TaxID=55208 RepID=A0AAW3EKP8_9GAMM|nr:hypothetical protein A7983_19245 [Pectobacterium wasabiae CFBP 3304]KFX09383.1 hypothetical protein JV38_00180 [Pectobacterium wasabiae]KGA29585.1 hypothetical protein KU73_03910 [Pectobacterium wasabiae]
MKTNDPEQLEKLKNSLKYRLGLPAGWHMIGLPLIASMILAVVSFALPQPFIWLAIFSWLDLPQYAVMAAIVPAAFLYSAITIIAVVLISRGFLAAIKIYLFMLFLTALVAIIYFLSAFVPALFGAERKLWFVISSLVGLVFISCSIKCINSAMFLRTNALYLHNRVWRKQLNIQWQKHLF